MKQDDFSDAAVVLVGHGTSLDPGAGATVVQQAKELRRQARFADVREAFWKQEPRLSDVLLRLAQPRVFIVPLFASEGYFSEHVIPRALGYGLERLRPETRVQQRGATKWIYCPPVGTHEKMAEVILDRARSIVEQFPFPHAPAPRETSLFIAGHGTEQNENSRAAVESHVDRIRQMGVYAAVHASFMEEEPRIGACFGLARTRYLVMVPFFMGEGPHVTEDIPVLLGETKKLVHERLAKGEQGWRNPTERKGKLLWYSLSVGSHPLLAEVILERVREGAAWITGGVTSPGHAD